jgi:AcrR family transcriptional regulator
VTRASIVSVALESLQANGMAGLALRDVARRLGVSLPSVQRHFATKDELWRACVDAALESVVLPLPPEGGIDPRSGVGRHLKNQFERGSRMPGFTAAMSNDSEPGADARLDYLAERARPVIDGWLAALSAGSEAGLLRPVPAKVVLAVIALGVSSLASSRQGLLRLFGIDLDDDASRQEVVDSIGDLLLYGLLPRD